jgi:hypothetical protein
MKGDDGVAEHHGKQTEERNQIGREPERQKLGGPAPKRLKDVVGEQRVVFAVVGVGEQVVQLALVRVLDHAPNHR